MFGCVQLTMLRTFCTRCLIQKRLVCGPHVTDRNLDQLSHRRRGPARSKKYHHAQPHARCQPSLICFARPWGTACVHTSRCSCLEQAFERASKFFRADLSVLRCCLLVATTKALNCKCPFPILLHFRRKDATCPFVDVHFDSISQPYNLKLFQNGLRSNLVRLAQSLYSIYRFHVDPSGTYNRYEAKAIGSGSEGAQQSLQEVYHKVRRAAAPACSAERSREQIQGRVVCVCLCVCVCVSGKTTFKTSL